MIIKTLSENLVDVNLGGLYIKPFYDENNNVLKYAICSNEKNVESVLGAYSDRTIAKHMLHILQLCQDSPITVDMLSELNLCYDLLASAEYKLNRVKAKSKKKEF